jgi:hypothetical protein
MIIDRKLRGKKKEKTWLKALKAKEPIENSH